MASKKDRTWTKLLEASGSRVINHPQFQQTLTRRKLIAEMVMHAITNGTIYYVDGSEERIDGKDWVAFVKWLYNHIDGPAPSKVQMSTPEGEAVRFEDVSSLSAEERLARLATLYERARVERARSTAGNGTANAAGLHEDGLEDTGA